MFRKAIRSDIDAILKLINIHAEKGQMLFLSRQDINRNIENFLVMEQKGKLFATCRLKIGLDKLLEIRSLAVHPSFYRRGLGTALVQKCLMEAKKMDVEKVFVLRTIFLISFNPSAVTFLSSGVDK